MEMKHPLHEHPLRMVDEEQQISMNQLCSGCRQVIVSGSGSGSGPSSYRCLERGCNFQLHKKCAEAPLHLDHPLHPGHGLYLREVSVGSKGHACRLCMQKDCNMVFYECSEYCFFALDIYCALSSISSSFKLEQHDVHPHPLAFIQNLNLHFQPLKASTSAAVAADCSLCHQPLLVHDHDANANANANANAYAVYICVGDQEEDCPFRLHNKCLDKFESAPQIEIDHPSHRIHPLTLNLFQNTSTTSPLNFCNVCQKKHAAGGAFYCCSPCNFGISIECAWPRPIIKSHYHQHPFSLVLSQPSFSFICDACGIEGRCMSYICSTCNIMVHKDCTSVPPTIKIPRHHHPISHKYYIRLQNQNQKQAAVAAGVAIASSSHQLDDDEEEEEDDDDDDDEQDCRICLKKVKKEHGSYSCVKLKQQRGCNYIVHVKCAIDKDYWYDIIESDDEDEVQEQADESGITDIVIEDGKQLVKHFLHQHYLMLQDNNLNCHEKEVESATAGFGNGDDQYWYKYCDGCILPIAFSNTTDPFYYCCNSQSQCHFLLHKACAELPRTMHHWIHPSVATLRSVDFGVCYLCLRQCSGFFYEIRGLLYICVRCVKIPDVIKSRELRGGHRHFLYYDDNCKWQYNGCGNKPSIWDRGVYRCGKLEGCSSSSSSNFGLDFGCLTLPKSVKHALLDQHHLLKLTYPIPPMITTDDHSKEEDTDDFYDPYCDICEEKRNPNHWFYHCAICDLSAHPRCVLGHFPFLKHGFTLEADWNPHGHDLIFVKKIDDYPWPNCSVCGKLCQAEALKCASATSTCNYTVHFQCQRWK